MSLTKAAYLYGWLSGFPGILIVFAAYAREYVISVSRPLRRKGVKKKGKKLGSGAQNRHTIFSHPTEKKMKTMRLNVRSIVFGELSGTTPFAIQGSQSGHFGEIVSLFLVS